MAKIDPETRAEWAEARRRLERILEHDEQRKEELHRRAERRRERLHRLSFGLLGR